MIAPLGRTPMDKKSGRSMQDYSKKLTRMIDDMTPWNREAKFNALRRKYGGDPDGDERVFVMLGAGEDPNDPLYKDAKIVKNKKG
jgi:hypothetical protein